MMAKIIPVSRFEDFEDAIAKMEYRFWVFRGHGETTWRIESSLARFYRSHQANIKPSSFYPRGADSIDKFRKSAHLHLHHLPAENDLLGWLAVMQHFGAPTRLIDFTFSPYVALFFALEKSTAEIIPSEQLDAKALNEKYRPFEIHAVHLKSVRHQTEQILQRTGWPDDGDYFIGRGRKQQKEFVGFFEGNWKNQRQVAQQGLFMIPSKINLNVEKYLKSCESTSTDFSGFSWVRFQFPGGFKAYSAMVNRLLRANVGAEALFPGLEGSARSISMGFYAPKIQLR